MAKYSVLTDNEKDEAVAEAMLKAAARKGFNQGMVVGACIAAITSVICTAINHYQEKKQEVDVLADDYEWPF